MVKLASFLGWILLVWGGFSPLQAVEENLRQQLIQTIESLQTLEADFEETGPERVAKGKVFLKRPSSRESNAFGKLKFVYAPPVPLEIVSVNGTVYVANHKTQTLETHPLSSTPLFVLLRPEIRLGDLAIEKELKEEGDLIYWTLTKEEDTGGEQPEITLIFKRGSLDFQGWVIHDLTGKEITVHLNALKKGLPLKETLFKKPHVVEK